MVVVDSSALIPLAWIGRLDFIPAVFDDIESTERVEAEVVVEGKRGTAALERFLDTVTGLDSPDDAEELAALEGIAVTDGSVILLAAGRGDILLANDKGLIEVARSHGIDCWWLTTLLLRGVNGGVLDANEANDVLYDLVDSGMNLTPQVYVQVQKRLREVGE